MNKSHPSSTGSLLSLLRDDRKYIVRGITHGIFLTGSDESVKNNIATHGYMILPSRGGIGYVGMNVSPKLYTYSHHYALNTAAPLLFS